MVVTINNNELLNAVLVANPDIHKPSIKIGNIVFIKKDAINIIEREHDVSIADSFRQYINNNMNKHHTVIGKYYDDDYGWRTLIGENESEGRYLPDVALYSDAKSMYRPRRIIREFNEFKNYFSNK